MLDEYEAVAELVGFVWTAMTLLVTVAAAVAAVSVGKVPGLWVVTAGAAVLFLSTVATQLQRFADLSPDGFDAFIALTTLVTLLANGAMLLGLAFVRPARGDSNAGARGVR